MTHTDADLMIASISQVPPAGLRIGSWGRGSEELADQPAGGLDQLLSRVHYLLGEIANLVNERYFDHTAGPQPMRPLDGEESP